MAEDATRGIRDSSWKFLRVLIRVERIYVVLKHLPMLRCQSFSVRETSGLQAVGEIDYVLFSISESLRQ